MNLQIAQVYLQHADPALAGWTWQHIKTGIEWKLDGIGPE
jgi:hypothetical protein